MYEELIRALRHCAKRGVCNGCPRCGKRIKNCPTELYREAADAIEKLSKPRWVSVNERLPEDGVSVLCWYEYYHWSKEKVLPEYGIGYQYHGQWGGEAGTGRDCNVIAWMPLQEPPKEKTYARETD